MTVETFTPAAAYTVAGIGPYAIGHPYLEGSIRIFTTVSGAEVELPTSDYSLSPVAATVSGNLFLTPAAAAAQAGRELRIRRVTPPEQGWVGVQGEREKGLERQLDRLTYSVQENSALQDRTLRTRDPIAPFVPQTGRTLLFDGTAIIAGPNATDVANAQDNAAAAQASATAAAGSASAAAASAATINLPSIAGKALNYLRANAGATGQEYRTPAQVRSDIGATTVGASVFTAADIAAARAALGATTVGASVFTAADAASARTAIGVAGWTEIPQIITTGGTAFDIINIPDLVTEIEIMFNFVSITGTTPSSILVQLGDPVNGFNTTGYWSGQAMITNASSPSLSFSSTVSGFYIENPSIADFYVGNMRLVRGTRPDYWTCTFSVLHTTPRLVVGAGNKYLLGNNRLDRLRITRTSTGNFDNGVVGVRYR